MMESNYTSKLEWIRLEWVWRKPLTSTQHRSIPQGDVHGVFFFQNEKNRKSFVT